MLRTQLGSLCHRTRDSTQRRSDSVVLGDVGVRLVEQISGRRQPVLVLQKQPKLSLEFARGLVGVGPPFERKVLDERVDVTNDVADDDGGLRRGVLLENLG